MEVFGTVGLVANVGGSGDVYRPHPSQECPQNAYFFGLCYARGTFGNLRWVVYGDLLRRKT